MRHILLDSSPLGLLSSPASSTQVAAITNWSVSCLSAGHRLYVPEVIDYEVRRELVRAGKSAGIARLDALSRRCHNPQHLPRHGRTRRLSLARVGCPRIARQPHHRALAQHRPDKVFFSSPANLKFVAYALNQRCNALVFDL